MTATPDLSRLRDPFPADDVDWRIGQSGKTRDGRPWAKVVPYLQNRAVMDRLDAVCGAGGWENRFEKAPNSPDGKALICGIGIEVAPGRVVWKWDGAENTDFEAVKGGISDSMKRAAVQWGIGRYLYGTGEQWADCTTESMRGQDGWRWTKTKDFPAGLWWKPPELPASMLPRPEEPRRPEPTTNGTIADGSNGPKVTARDERQPAAAASPPDRHRRGDDRDPRQWLDPPAEVVAQWRKGDFSHTFSLSAWKALRPKPIDQQRALIWFLTPDGQDPPEPATVDREPEVAYRFVAELKRRNAGGQPIPAIIGEAIRAYNGSDPEAEGDG